jgi:hypothetical protein
MGRQGIVSINDRARDNLRYIRETMERAGSFTAVPGWGGVYMGISALAASWIASRMLSRDRWFAVWIGEALVAFAIGFWAMIHKAKTARVFLKGPGRAFALSLFPAMFAGTVLTLVLYRHGIFSLLPGLWMLLYGVAVVSGGTNSVRIVPVLGMSFIVFGTLALALGPEWANIEMAMGFGMLHVVFGVLIARRYGG